MSNYIVSARKYRPGTFVSVVGQGHITNTLKSAILLDQLAHAFLFSGPRGVGKTTCARILAKAINCENLQEDGEPCNTCQSCNSYNEGKSINIHELDAASNNSVDDIRNLIEQTRYVPANGKKSVYIIDEVHMLSQAAFNAFLKTLEEPPPHAMFILATTEKHKILPTILSRCQKFDFRRIKVDDIAKHLEYISKEEGIDYEYAALQQIALKADGALRDALSLYDQLVSYSGKDLDFSSVLENLNILDYDYYFKAVNLIEQADHSSLLLLLNEIVEKGFEAKEFLVGLTEHFRNLLVCHTPKTVELLETSENVKQRYMDQKGKLDPSYLLNAFNLCSEAEQKIRFVSHPRLTVELALIKLAHLGTAVRIAAGEEVPVQKKKPPVVEQKQVATEAVPEKQLEEPIVPTNEDKSLANGSHEPEDAPIETPGPIANGAVELEQNGEKALVSTQDPVSVVAKSPSRKKKIASAEFKLASNFEQAQEAYEKAVNETDSSKVEEDEPTTYELNPSVKVDEEGFTVALKEYTSKLRSKGSFTLASVLDEAQHSFHHNEWHMGLENELQQQLVERETDLLSFIREKIQVSDMYMVLNIVKNASQVIDSQPYTTEEKLKAMSDKNPNLLKLQEIFKTRIVY